MWINLLSINDAELEGPYGSTCFIDLIFFLSIHLVLKMDKELFSNQPFWEWPKIKPYLQKKKLVYDQLQSNVFFSIAHYYEILPTCYDQCSFHGAFSYVTWVFCTETVELSCVSQFRAVGNDEVKD